MTGCNDNRTAEILGTWTHNGLSLTERAVLACLLVQACSDKPSNRARSCHSYAQIAALTGLSVRAAGEAHRSLRARGVLVDVRQREYPEPHPGAFDVSFDLSCLPPVYQLARESAAAKERAAIVAWLLAVDDEGGGSTWGLACAIEQGEHIVK